MPRKPRQSKLFAGENIIGSKNNIIDKIVSAGKERKTLTITYKDSKGQITVRETEPYEIKGDKYWGYSLDKNSIRCFSIDGISDAKINDKKYTPRWEVKF